jgi:hypothetical protein
VVLADKMTSYFTSKGGNKMSLKNETTRAYIYRVLVALVPILVFYGALDESQVAVWLGLASSVLGFGLASANTSTKPQ